MKKSIKVILVLLCLLTVIFVGYIGQYTEGFHNEPHVPNISQEKLVIQSAFYNSAENSVILTVKSIKENITINNAIIKDSNGDALTAPISISYSILEDETKTLTVNCSISSGNYTILLLTPRGSTFVSPSFNVS